ncbi:MAG: hypothetical protein AAF572_15000 [Cyanobacteria bacterium P01_B01_bin.77]
MQPKGPFFKAFAIALPFFVFHLVPNLRMASAASVYDAGYITGQIVANHLVAAVITGLLGKFGIKHASWTKTMLMYLVIVIPVIGLNYVGGGA